MDGWNGMGAISMDEFVYFVRRIFLECDGVMVVKQGCDLQASRSFIFVTFFNLCERNVRTAGARLLQPKSGLRSKAKRAVGRAEEAAAPRGGGRLAKALWSGSLALASAPASRRTGPPSYYLYVQEHRRIILHFCITLAVSLPLEL